jgi:hypothetical protein
MSTELEAERSRSRIFPRAIETLELETRIVALEKERIE